jgi:hypothetical protein
VSVRPSTSVTRSLGRRRFVRRSFTITGSLPRPKTHSSYQSRSAVSSGSSDSPFSVSRYSKRAGRPRPPVENPVSTSRRRRSEDVLRDPEVRFEIAEAARAEERVAHDQERPPIAERLERLGDAAVHVGKALASHRSQPSRF